MIGFTFNNVHSRDMGVVFKSDDRTLLPAKRITQYKIPGKSGTYDIADGYDNRQISCTVAFVGAGNAYAGVRQTARASRNGSPAKVCLFSMTNQKRRTAQRSLTASELNRLPLPGIAALRFCVSRSRNPSATTRKPCSPFPCRIRSRLT